MKITCLLGAHRWHACRCKGCGKTRDTEHEWQGCHCSVCQKTRDLNHSWAGGDGWTCVRCGRKLRDLIEDGKVEIVLEEHGFAGFPLVRYGKEEAEAPLSEAVDYFATLPKGQGIEHLAALSTIAFAEIALTAVAALRELRDSRAVPALIGALRYAHDSNHNIQITAAESLGELGDVSAVPALIEFLEEGGWCVRHAAAALARLKDARAIAPLIRAARARDDKGNWRSETDRAHAADALGLLAQQGSVEVLLGAIADPALQEAAVFALARNNTRDARLGKEVVALWNALPERRDQYWLRLLLLNLRTEEKTEILRHCLNSRNEHLVAEAGAFLAKTGDRSSDMISALLPDIETALDWFIQEVKEVDESGWPRCQPALRIAAFRSLARPKLPVLDAMRNCARLPYVVFQLTAAMACIDEDPTPYIMALLQARLDTTIQGKALNLDPFAYVAHHSRSSPWAQSVEALKVLGPRERAALGELLSTPTYAPIAEDVNRQLNE